MMSFRCFAAIICLIQNGGTTVLPSSQEIAENYLKRVAGYVAADVDMMINDGAGMTPERSARIKQVIFQVVDISIATQRPFYELNEIAFTLNELRRSKTTKPEFFLCYMLGQHLHAFPQALVEMMNSFQGLSRLMNLARSYGMSEKDTYFLMYYPTAPWSGARSAIRRAELVSMAGPFQTFPMEGIPDEELLNLITMRDQYEVLYPWQVASFYPFLDADPYLISALRYLTSAFPASHEGKMLIRKSLDIMTRLSEATIQANQQHYMIAREVLRDLSVVDIKSAGFFDDFIPRLTPPISILEAALHSSASGGGLKSQLIERVISSFAGTLIAPLFIKAVHHCPVANLPLFEVLIDIAVRVMQRSSSSLSSLASVIDSIAEKLLIQKRDYSKDLVQAAFVLTSKLGIRVLHDYPGLLGGSEEWSSEKILALRTIIGCTIHFDHRSVWYSTTNNFDNIASASAYQLEQVASILMVLNKRLIQSWSDAPFITPSVLFRYQFTPVPHKFVIDLHFYNISFPPFPRRELDRFDNLPRVITEFLKFNPRRIEVYTAMEQRANYISANYRGKIPIDVLDKMLASPSETLHLETIHSVFSKFDCFKPITDKLINPALDLIEAFGRAVIYDPIAFSPMREYLKSINKIVGICLMTGTVAGVDELIAQMRQLTQQMGSVEP